MTRCLNCGAERDADICAACGLASAAAEISLRLKLLNRTAVFLLGALAFVVASARYPALELDGILIFIGVLFFLTLNCDLGGTPGATPYRSGSLEARVLRPDSDTVAVGGAAPGQWCAG